MFARTDDIVDFTTLEHRLAVHEAARRNFAEAVLTQPQVLQKETGAGIILSQRLPQGFVQGASLKEWYDSKLTVEQRIFVDKPHEGPVRLRGAAGTGKTLSLVIKLLRDGMRAEADGRDVRFGLLTHSFASVDLVNAIAESLDSGGLMFGQGKHAKLEVRTLNDLAFEHLHFNLENLRPLSLDGREGRRLQFELIQGVLREMAASKILPSEFDGLTPELKERWFAAAQKCDDRFVAEVMNEFACVLDADGIRAGEERAERYATFVGSRPAWLMALPSELDRRFVLEVHRRYRKLLSEMNTLSVDEMVADFDSFLNSNRWDRLRSRRGFDALFVDELHLFTSIERLTLHKLIKPTVDDEGRPRRPPIFMAYDLKQSPRDTFTEYGDPENNLFTPKTGLQNSDLVFLNKVFRYTKEIAEFLSDLDATFPAMIIPGEWEAYNGEAEESNGVPELIVFPDERKLFKSVFDAARRVARSTDGGGRRMAVLCASEEYFDQYLTAASGQFEGQFLAITSRQPSSELRHAGKRFIFSMPEYVAGLQFQTVFLIHVDAREAPKDAAFGVRRQFISNVYLGSSRAEQILKLVACTARGGPSDILSMPVERGSLRRGSSI